MPLLTQQQIRTQLVTLIGLPAVQKLEAAGMMPTAQEEGTGVATRAPETNSDGFEEDVMRYPKMVRLVTDWQAKKAAP